MNRTLHAATFEVRVNSPLEVSAVFSPVNRFGRSESIRVALSLTQEAHQKLLEILRQRNYAVLTVL